MENSELDQPFSPVDILQNERRSTRANVITSLDDDPESAARAQTLAENTGAHPALVHADVEGFEAQYKTSLVSKLLNDNKYLAEYANSHPLAAKISNDDWGNLDAASSAISKLGSGAGSVLGKAFQGFKDNFDADSMQADQQKLAEYLQQNPLFGNIFIRQATQGVGLALEGSLRAFSGVIGGAAAGVGELAKQLGSNEAEADRLTRDLIVMAQVGLSGQAGLHGIVHPKLHTEIAKFQEFRQVVEPYLKAGIEPPYGLHEVVDKMKERQSKLDLDNLSDALKEAQASNTRERNPDMFAGFVRQHTDTNIGISADAVRKLYGDKPPLADDNLLGFVPRLAEQLQLAEMGGGDIQVPLADWLAKVDPALAKELHDDIRVRPGGVTKNEVKEAAEVRKVKADLIEEPVSKPEGEEVASTDPNNQAVVATRKAAALDTTLDKALDDLFNRLSRGYDYTTDAGIKARIVPTKELLAEEKQIEKKMNDLLNRIAGKSVRRKIADFVGIGDREVQGAYISFDKTLPVILYSLKAENIPNTVRHEAIHFLRDYNFITKEEWSALEIEAETKGWLKKHNITEQYGGQRLNHADLIEEAIAKEYGEWGSTTAKAEELTAKYSKEAGATFQKIKDILAQIKDAIKEIFGHSPDVAELFEKIESGEVAKRGPGEPSAGTKDIRANQFELPQAGTTRMAERELFTKASAIGMTVDQYKRYMKLIEKRRTEDQTAIAEIALKEERKHQTQEWKDNSAVIRGEVAADINQRPDIAADEFLRAGEHKLSPEGLTSEQVAALPKKLVGPSGVRADDIAGFFGYTTGSQLVDRLVQLNAARDAAGMKPEAYRRRVIEAETERRMQVKFGDLDRNIIEEAKEHVLSETQMDLLHEETLALGMKAGSELSITKEQMKAWVKGEFDKTPLRAIDSDKYLAAAGKAGRNAEMHLLKEDPGEAFKYKQQQWVAFTMATEAKKLEKAREQFDRTAKRFASREVSTVAPEYTNYIQSLLLRLGRGIKRSIQDLQENIARGDYKNFNDFVAAKTSDLRDLHVPEFLLDDNFQKKLEDLSVQEFQQVHDAIKAMVHNGRDELKVLKGGEAADLKEVINEMKEKIATLGPAREYPIDRKPNAVIDTAKSWWWSGITVESMMNRLDRGNPHGIFYQTITRHFTDASNHKDRMIRDYQKKVSAIGHIPDMDKMIDNALFEDPLTGQPFPMRRRNVLGVLQNVGNANNLKKLAEGYGLKPESIMSWLARNTTKEDWDRAQKIGDTFADLFDKANTMSHQISGVGIQRLPLEPIETPFGTYPGWYNPVKYDPVRPGKSKALLGPDVPEVEGYYRATTPQGYTNQRTGYIAPMELNLDIIPVRMKQMIHDITMRPAVIQLSKIFYNPEFKRAMIKYYGQHQAEEMIPFLRDIANSANFKSMSTHLGETALEYIRQNTIATLIGFNPGTVMKHGTTALFNSMTEVGATNWTREFSHLIGPDEASGKRNWTMAMEKSEELSRRMRNFQELVSGHGAEINIKGANSTFGSYREFMMSAGATPVSISDLLSAVPTFLAEYKKQIVAGMDEGMAVSLGNRAVRQAHGSSVLSNKPSIARTNALGAWFSALYGFFSHMQQKQYMLNWMAKDLLKDTIGKGSGDAELATRHAPDILKGFMSYVIIPAVIEELVTPYTNSEKESWGVKAAKTLAMGISSSFIGVRDLVRAIINVRDPQAGLVGTSYKAGSDLIRDLSKGKQAFGKDKAGNIIKHTATLTGVLTGLTNAQEGRMAEYMYRYSQGLEKPQGVWEAAVGLRYGKTEGHPKTFEKYLQHLKGH